MVDVVEGGVNVIVWLSYDFIVEVYLFIFVFLGWLVEFCEFEDFLKGNINERIFVRMIINFM